MKKSEFSNIIFRKKLLIVFFLLSSIVSFSQRIEPINKDSTTISEKKIVQEKKIDSATKKIYSPKKAATLSAIFPGLGQIYNKKYWKLPIVYAAMGISGGIFKYNLGWYKKTRFAYKVLVTSDTANFPNVDPALQFLIVRNDAGGLRNARDGYRRDIDYSALFFIIMWGLNVVDATVDAHLKSFDVSPALSLGIKAGHSEMAGTNGISLVLSIR